jgi:putative NIF3 family GTP cyclohydrolase 1 type 2
MEVDAILTGEIKHHVGLELALRGILAFDAGHDVSERIVLPDLSHRLAALAPQLTFAVDLGFDYNRITF